MKSFYGIASKQNGKKFLTKVKDKTRKRLYLDDILALSSNEIAYVEKPQLQEWSKQLNFVLPILSLMIINMNEIMTHTLSKAMKNFNRMKRFYKFSKDLKYDRSMLEIMFNKLQDFIESQNEKREYSKLFYLYI